MTQCWALPKMDGQSEEEKISSFFVSSCMGIDFTIQKCFSQNGKTSLKDFSLFWAL